MKKCFPFAVPGDVTSILKRIETVQKQLDEKADSILREQAIILAALTEIRSSNIATNFFGADTAEDFAKKYNLTNFPFKSLDEFLGFDLMLNENKDMLDDFVSKEIHLTFLFSCC